MLIDITAPSVSLGSPSSVDDKPGRGSGFPEYSLHFRGTWVM